MAIYARFHRRGNFLRDDVTIGNGAVASAAIDACFAVPRMAEKNEIGYRVHLIRREGPGVIA
jgi:hypothetical protein